MSHKVTVKTQIKNPEVAAAAAKAMGLPCRVGRHSVEIFSGEVQADISVQLKGWIYPIAINIKTGECHFDNYNGKWGNAEELLNFTQEYLAQIAEHEAEELTLQGWNIERVALENGDVQVKLTQGL